VKRDRTLRPSVTTTALLAGALGLGAGSARAQIPDKFTNLQILPKDITKPKLVEIMRGFAGGLGVRCGFCHVGEGPGLTNMDFASDDKDNKKTARVMLRMVRAINGDYLASLGDEHRTRVECQTCHRGVTEPERLDALLEEVIEEKGAEAAVARYKELREKYLEQGSYDFSDWPLNRLGESLVKDKKAGDAVTILELNAEVHPASGWTRYLLGEAYQAAGDRDKAKASYRKALELAPDNEAAKKRLEELEKPQG
jgi:Photosynthetic reaction centre cytochrome C subunit/Tetratricopeptide repeat